MLGVRGSTGLRMARACFRRSWGSFSSSLLFLVLLSLPTRSGAQACHYGDGTGLGCGAGLDSVRAWPSHRVPGTAAAGPCHLMDP